MAEILSLDLYQTKIELLKAYKECSSRRLLYGAKWVAELSSSLAVSVDLQVVDQCISNDDLDVVNLATSYFDLKEYERCANVVRDQTAQLPYFLHMYALFMAIETHKFDHSSNVGLFGENNCDNSKLRHMKSELSSRHRELDGFGLYLYGVVLVRLDLTKLALEVLVEAVNKQPTHWGGWQELAKLVTDKEMLQSLQIPNHWVRWFFLAHVYQEHRMHDKVLDIYQNFIAVGFSNCNYIIAQLAITYHSMQDVDKAVSLFEELQKVDPFCLEHMDIFSNMLYVKEMKASLAHLAHRCCDINKYRVETCCVIGNYYSLRSEHEKAILYFQRALRLNPHYLSAWTLMGHEFMELKNTSAAIQAYRQAIEVNKQDYRAWYGLGQTYELLKMPFFSLYYYRQAHAIKPNDSRMLVALGECYEKLEWLQEAKKCYRKAHNIGDAEGGSLFKLAKLHEKLSERDQAASAYREFISDMEMKGAVSHVEISQAYLYLAYYHWFLRQLDEAYTAAQKCAEFNETREDAKAILQKIQAARSQKDVILSQFNDSMGSITSTYLPPGEQMAFDCISPVNLRFTR